MIYTPDEEQLDMTQRLAQPEQNRRQLEREND